MAEKGFHTVLYEQMLEMNLNMNSLSAYLREKNVVIYKSAIHYYINAMQIPTFEKAREILDALNYKTSEEELLEMLSISQEIRETEKNGDQNCLCGGIRISYRNLSDNEKNPSKIRFIVEKRIEEMGKILPGKGGLSAYIAALIKADIDFNILDDFYKKEDE